MATASQNDYDVTSTWTNVVATIAGIASVDTLIQNLSTTPVWVAPLASGGPPSGKTGVVLGQYDSFKVNAAQVWVRTPSSSAKIGVTTV